MRPTSAGWAPLGSSHVLNPPPPHTPSCHVAVAVLSPAQDIKIGETICAREAPVPLPTIKVEDPTVSMTFKVNTSPFAGKEGKYVTSRNLKERLDRELERNLALRVEPGETADAFIVSGRGTLHLGILIENMRREGFEFEIGPPKVRGGEGGGTLGGKRWGGRAHAWRLFALWHVGSRAAMHVARVHGAGHHQGGGGQEVRAV